jgi:hypothetical protein
MKTVIKEQAFYNDRPDSSLNTQLSNNDYSGNSPTYSMTEEDQIELSLNNPIAKAKYNATNETSANFHKYSIPQDDQTTIGNTHSFKEQAENTIVTIDLRSSEENYNDENLNPDNMNPYSNDYTEYIADSDEKIAVVINDLTLSHPDKQLMQNNDTINSQSILNNVIFPQPLDVINEDVCGQGMNEIDKEVTKLLNINQPSVSNRSIEKNTKEFYKNTISYLPEGSNIPRETSDNHIVTVRTNEQLINANNDKVLHTNDFTIGAIIQTKPTKKKGKTASVKVTKTYTKVVPKSKRKLGNKKLNEDRKVYCQLSNVLPKDIKIPNVNETSTCNNNNDMDDLSWINGIKYVREIHVEEYDAMFNVPSESFWENYDVPVGWNDMDFD